MIQAIIADDQKIAIESLKKNIDWKSKGFELVATALNGNEAWEKFQEHMPQVVITDIQMPGISGIELARRIKELAPETIVIFISNFDHFHYARSALNLGIFDYVLKDEDSASYWNEKLDEVKRLLHRQNFQDYFFEEGKLNHLIAEHFSSAADMNLERCQELFPGTYSTVILRQKHILPCLANASGRKTEEPSETLIKMVVYESSMEVKSIVRFDDYQFILLLKRKSDVRTVATQIKNLLYNRLAVEYSMFIISQEKPIDQLLGDLSATHGWLQSPFFYPAPVILDTQLMMGTEPATESLSLDHLQQILRTRQFDNALQCIEQHFFQIIQTKDYATFCVLVQFLLAYLSEFNNNIFDYKRGRMFILFEAGAERFWTCANDVKEWLKGKILLFFQIFSENALYQYSKEVYSAIRYVMTHYMDSNLTIQEIADHVGISVNHLNTMMKKEEDTTIGKYLARYRMEQATDLIQSGRYSITEIYPQVGYVSLSSFSKMYKQMYGISPHEFRRQSHEEKHL